MVSRSPRSAVRVKNDKTHCIGVGRVVDGIINVQGETIFLIAQIPLGISGRECGKLSAMDVTSLIESFKKRISPVRRVVQEGGLSLMSAISLFLPASQDFHAETFKIMSI